MIRSDLSLRNSSAHLYTHNSLYETCPWEERVVRRWIMEGQVAPRFPGIDAPVNGMGTSGAIATAGLEAAATAAATGLSAGRAPGGGSSAGTAGTAGLAGSEKAYRTEECPICFMHYQGVNRTVCCSKPLCTECYLQVGWERRSEGDGGGRGVLLSVT